MTTAPARPRDSSGRYAKSTDMVAIPQDEFSALQHSIGVLEANNYRMEERLQSIDSMIDEKGWTPLYDYGSDGGLSLEQVHSSAKQIRDLVVGNPFMKRGSQLRITYVNGGGVEFSANRATDGKSATFSTAIRAIMRNPVNKKTLFSAGGREIMERAAFTDGTVLCLADDADKTYRLIPVTQIKGMLHNPDDPSEVWAYRRSWKKKPTDLNDTVEWYYTDWYGDQRRDNSIVHNQRRERINTKRTIIDVKVNAHAGWALGVPDGLAALGWVRLYREFLVNGSIMSRALATFAFKATMQSQTGADKAALKMGDPKKALERGRTVLSDGDFSPLTTAGKGYDFNSGRPLAAGIAAALEVSLVGLLSDPGAGGGASSGTAQTLDPPARATAEMRRQVWNDFYERIFRHMGLVGTLDLDVTWKDLAEEQIHRQLQAITVAWNSGLFKDTVIQGLMAAVLNINDPGEVPAGVLMPNNKATAMLAKPQTTSPTAGSGQGQSNPGGQGQDDHDDDTPDDS